MLEHWTQLLLPQELSSCVQCISPAPSIPEILHILESNGKWKVLLTGFRHAIRPAHFLLIWFPAGLSWEIACTCHHVMPLCLSSFHISNASSLCPLNPRLLQPSQSNILFWSLTRFTNTLSVQCLVALLSGHTGNYYSSSMCFPGHNPAE